MKYHSEIVEVEVEVQIPSFLPNIVIAESTSY